MKNKEKFEKEIIDIAVLGDTFGLNKDNKIINCSHSDCSNCMFAKKSSCVAERIEWANEEYVEPKFTEEEKQLIKVLDKVEWIAKDITGQVWGYGEKPDKVCGIWRSEGCITHISQISSLSFKGIKVDDEEPVSREEVLGE